MPRLHGASYLKGESGWDISGITGGRVGTGRGCIQSNLSLSLIPVTHLQSAQLHQQNKITYCFSNSHVNC